MADFFNVRDHQSPEGEEKRIVATLKSWGARNADNVTMFNDVVSIGNKVSVVLTWHSPGGEFKARAWRVFLPLDSDMRTPDNVCAIQVKGSDGEWHWYPIHRRFVDRWLNQRLGNDFEPYLYNHHRDFWVDLGGYEVDKYHTVPSWAQWALGAFQFHFLREEVQVLVNNDPSSTHSSGWAWYESLTG